MDKRQIGWNAEEASVVGQLLIKRGRKMGRKEQEKLQGRETPFQSPKLCEPTQY